MNKNITIEERMKKIRESACGIDVHKDQLTTTIIIKERKYKQVFANTKVGLEELKELLRKYKCLDVAMEATGQYSDKVYWSLYSSGFRVVVANPYHVKMIQGNKNDNVSSEWLAFMHACGMIQPSFIPIGDDFKLRQLCRLRIKIIQQRTSMKNRAIMILDRADINLSLVLSDIFGKTGLLIIEQLMDGKSIEEIMENIKLHHSIKATKEEFIAAVGGNFSLLDRFLLQNLLETIRTLTRLHNNIVREMARIICNNKALYRALEILMSIIGISFVGAATVLGEIGHDITKWSAAKKLACWAGLTPKISQSNNVIKKGGITKAGSRVLRWILYMIAESVVKIKKTRLKSFYQRIFKRSGSKKKARVALARKILCIIHHLLSNDEYYEEKFVPKRVVPKIPRYIQVPEIDPIELLRELRTEFSADMARRAFEIFMEYKDNYFKNNIK